MNKDARIYVAGHRGLVGSAILRKLKAEGYENLILRTHAELNLARQADVETFFGLEMPEYVFLAAAKVGGIWANNNHPAEFIHENLMIQTNVIHAAYTARVRKLLFLGSSCIYPRECPQPMKEEYLLNGVLEPTNEPYAVAKIAGIKMCQSYNRQYGTRFISVMPTNLYGPGDNFDLETSHVLPALIRKFHEAKISEESRGKSDEPCRKAETRTEEPCVPGTPDASIQRSTEHGPRTKSVTIWGTGSPRREFMYVDDLADACLFLMNRYNESEIINIGIGKDISIKELAEIIRDITGFQGDIHYDPSMPDGTPRKLLDVNRLESLGWRSGISLKEGVRKTYEWYVRNSSENEQVTP